MALYICVDAQRQEKKKATERSLKCDAMSHELPTGNCHIREVKVASSANSRVVDDYVIRGVTSSITACDERFAISFLFGSLKKKKEMRTYVDIKTKEKKIKSLLRIIQAELNGTERQYFEL